MSGAWTQEDVKACLEAYAEIMLLLVRLREFGSCDLLCRQKFLLGRIGVQSEIRLGHGEAFSLAEGSSPRRLAGPTNFSG